MSVIDERGRLADGEAEALARRCADARIDLRKTRARERWKIYTEDYKPLIQARLDETLVNETYRNEVEKFISVSDNPALDVVQATSVVWAQGARRSVHAASDDGASAFTELVAESLIDVYAPKWNQIAEFVGPIHVVPAVRRKALRWDLLLPTYADVVPDPDDPHGIPLAASWTLRTQGKQRGEPDVAILDGHSWRFASTAGGGFELLPAREVEHGLGRFPGVPLRFDFPHDADYFGCTTRHQRFLDATISVGTIHAALGFTRKAQNSRLLSVVGFLGDAAKQQPLDPETGIVINVDPEPGKQPPGVETLDFDTPPKNFLDHVAGIRRSVAAAYGGTVDDQGRMTFDLDALAEVRNQQIPHARVFERQLWANAVAMCKAMKHPLATRLPDEEEVRKGFVVDFGKLSRTFADPQQESEHLDWLISKGALDQLDVLRAQGNQNLDDEQLKTKLEENLENQAWFNDAVTKRNLGMTPGGAATAAEANGLLGPAVRDGTPVTVQVSGEPAANEATGVAPETLDAPEHAANDQPETIKLPAPEENVQAAALNGSQIASFVNLATAIATGQLPLELVARFLPVAFPGAVPNVGAAQELLAPLIGFIASAPEQTAPEGAPAAPDGAEDEEP